MKTRQTVWNTTVLCKISLCAAIICVCSLIKFPLPFSAVPITAQTFAIGVTALLLTPSASCVTVAIYLLLGAVGLPVFSGGTAGIQVLMGPTAGFLLAFLVSAPLTSWLKNKIKIPNAPNIVNVFIAVVAGLPVCYFLGTLVLSIYTHQSFTAAIASAVLPFIAGDLLKALGAALLVASLKKAYPQICS